MKKKTTALGRLTVLLLVILLTASVVPLPTHAVSVAHFTDVPFDHWAFQYVERAYGDGAVVGTGGSPAAGTGIFMPNANMTYGQFFTMLVNAFYPEELKRVSKDGPWYAPAFRVAVNRQIHFKTLEELMELASYPINRYNAAWILTRILDDKCVVLPTEGERKVAAAKISDWDIMLQDDCWKYYVSSIYALGIITGVDDQGTFAGEHYITRATATVLYTRMADKIKSAGNDPKAFQIVFDGDWSAAPEGFKEAMAEEFHTIYPRLWARWANSNINKRIPVWLVPQEDISDCHGVTYPEYDWVRHQRTPYIKISQDMINQRHNFMRAKAVFAHELTHAATTPLWTSAKPSVWLAENVADYGLFRYASWADEAYLCAESFFQQDDETLHTWNYEPYVSSQWFFAYLDDKYPTTADRYGLTDSILLAMQNGMVTSDGGEDQNDDALNALIEGLTGYRDIEALRQQYVKELIAGEWVFGGFAGYADNYITEDLPGVQNPAYPKQALIEQGNLCFDAAAYGGSGEASAVLSANNLVDGDLSTRWEASRKDVAEPDKLNYGVKHGIVIVLYRPVTFDTYILYHEGSQGNSAENTRAWRITYYDEHKKEWVKLDEVQNNTQDVTTRSVKSVTTRQLWLEILDPSGTGDGTVRLYEFEVYRSEASN